MALVCISHDYSHYLWWFGGWFTIVLPTFKLLFTIIWVNYNISLPWIVRPFSSTKFDFQWGRTVRSWWNLPRIMDPWLTSPAARFAQVTGASAQQLHRPAPCAQVFLGVSRDAGLGCRWWETGMEELGGTWGNRWTWYLLRCSCNIL